MGFTTKGYKYGLNDRGMFPTVPDSEDDARKQFQNMFDQILNLLNDLITALNSADSGNSGAANIGSTMIEGVTGTTVREQLESIQANVIKASTAGILENSITDEKLADKTITGDKIADNTINGQHITGNSIETGHVKNAAITQDKLSTIQTITLAAGDTLVYDNTNGMLRLKVAECLATNPNGVQLAPVVYGTSATPPSGNYPAGTIYIQYEA